MRASVRRLVGRPAGPDDVVVGRIRGRTDDLIEELAPLEPRTSAVINRLSASRWQRLRHRVVTTGDGRTVAVVTYKRLCFDVWTAAVYLADPSAAEVVAGLIDRSPARTVTGAAVDVVPLADHLQRRRGSVLVPRFVAPHPVDGIAGPADERTRLASPADLDALVELYRRYELVPVPTVWQLRSYLRRTLASETVIVAVEDDTIVGAGMLESLTQQFLTLSDLVVHPDHRRQGVSARLLERTGAVAVSHGVGVAASLAPSNPMSFEHERVVRSSDLEAHHCSVSLRERWRGQARLRRLVGRVGRIDRGSVEVFRDPTDPSRPVADAGISPARARKRTR